MQATNSIYNHPPTPTTPTYPPSVPLSVYRELADELQVAQAQLKTLGVKNQQLTQENQLLRQEMTKLIQSCLRLQKLVDFPGQQPNQPHSQAPSTSNEGKNTTPPKAGTKTRPRQQVPRPRPPVSEVPGKKSQPASVSTPVMEMMQPKSQPVFIEEQEVRYYAANEPETKEISGWWLIISILLIMLTAFSAGYLVVRPLFEHQSR
ncbi:hypothetical protein H6G41_04660 [Tolypothrix sp. FACHB-123]|uniref:hypothetical protein n=1 Tax=Tolypothrix sp. FACHB-123 TaxID=2692868 RepID=UPI00168436C2|nr:hypothetical protein [Tolypothrix sp. FACHB-123]MBD2353918.1 hypothetical protein [Tolypothrix sp. FACHB-123]